MTFFSNADNLDPSNKLPFMPPKFRGRVRVDVCKGVTKRNGDKMFLCEFTVLSTNLPETVSVGGRHSWSQNMKEVETATRACISFLYAALGLDPSRDKARIDSEVKPKQNMLLNNAASDANPLAGAEVDLQTDEITTKANKPFTVHTFSAVAKAAA
jgi:hypothetical protein